MMHAPTTNDPLDRIPLAALILANLAPLAGVLFFGWEARDLLLLYWLENLVVGGWTLVRMLHAGRLRALFPALFFSFHYSFFCGGHGMFIIDLTSPDGQGAAGLDDADDGFPFLIPLHMLSANLAWIQRETPELLGLPLLAFVISHGVSTLYHHFIGGEDRERGAEDIMFDPYKRIMALHVAILIGAIAMLETGAATALPALLLLIAIKTAIDVHQHRAAHRKRREGRESRRYTPRRGPRQRRSEGRDDGPDYGGGD